MRPPEEVKRDLVKQWLEKAEKDFGLANDLVLENKPYPEAICFHSQQAAEKFLKAYLVWLQIEFPKTHDLDGLLDLICSIDNSIAESLRDITRLTDYGVDLRYPGHLPEITTEEAKAAVELAARVRETITSALKINDKREENS